KIDILVATTVLEVGIDVANASVMVIEHAERFGLSQLHQLRGRIGRGEYESHCILISRSQTEEAKRRIRAMVDYTDGFRIAEEDLRIRGPGEFFGERQHGLSELKIADPLTQLQLLKRARAEARRLISLDPNLEWRQNLSLRKRLKQKFPSYEKYVTVG
ncbi:MAG: DNA helicase RecG, partial [Candidatus Omnitrophica bacterium]|nr:DNA helicase RecG [Candidatus Omnitrophota bacterium]